MRGVSLNSNYRIIVVIDKSLLLHRLCIWGRCLVCQGNCITTCCGGMAFHSSKSLTKMANGSVFSSSAYDEASGPTDKVVFGESCSSAESTRLEPVSLCDAGKGFPFFHFMIAFHKRGGLRLRRNSRFGLFGRAILQHLHSFRKALDRAAGQILLLCFEGSEFRSMVARFFSNWTKTSADLFFPAIPEKRKMSTMIRTPAPMRIRFCFSAKNFLRLLCVVG